METGRREVLIESGYLFYLIFYSSLIYYLFILLFCKFELVSCGDWERTGVNRNSEGSAARLGLVMMMILRM